MGFFYKDFIFFNKSVFFYYKRCKFFCLLSVFLDYIKFVFLGIFGNDLFIFFIIVDYSLVFLFIYFVDVDVIIVFEWFFFKI